MSDETTIDAPTPETPTAQPTPMRPVTPSPAPRLPWWRYRNDVQTTGAPRAVVVAVLVAGIVGAICWRIGALGLGYTITGLVTLGVVVATAPSEFRTGADRYRWAVLGGIVGLLLIPSILAADWVVAICLLVAFCAALAVVVDARGLIGLWVAALAPWFAAFAGLGWLFRRRPDGQPLRERADRRTLFRVVFVAIVTVLLLLIFGALFASADPNFGRLFSFDADFSVNVNPLPAIFSGLAVSLAALGCAYLTHAGVDYPERPESERPPRWMWATPIGALLALFALFLAIQAGTLFRGDDFIRDPNGPTYAEYARQGFGQLVAVTLLVIIVIAGAWRVADHRDRSSRSLMRVLLGGLCLATLGVAASAFHRMILYVDAYGATPARLFGLFVETHLALVVVLMIVAGIRWDVRWLTRGIVVLSVFVTLFFALLNPDRLSAAITVDHYTDTGKLDTHQLADLSPDAREEILRLPAEERACILRVIENRESSQWRALSASVAQFRADDRVTEALRQAPSTSCLYAD